jgi:hypothetical protein
MLIDPSVIGRFDPDAERSGPRILKRSVAVCGTHHGNAASLIERLHYDLSECQCDADALPMQYYQHAVGVFSEHQHAALDFEHGEAKDWTLGWISPGCIAGRDEMGEY